MNNKSTRDALFQFVFHSFIFVLRCVHIGVMVHACMRTSWQKSIKYSQNTVLS